jgi:hypothetical protein
MRASQSISVGITGPVEFRLCEESTNSSQTANSGGDRIGGFTEGILRIKTWPSWPTCCDERQKQTATPEPEGDSKHRKKCVQIL